MSEGPAEIDVEFYDTDGKPAGLAKARLRVSISDAGILLRATVHFEAQRKVRLGRCEAWFGNDIKPMVLAPPPLLNPGDIFRLSFTVEISLKGRPVNIGPVTDCRAVR